MKVILITGCSSGFGCETAKHFSRAGWKVYAGIRIINERSVAELELDKNRNIHPLQLDITNQVQIKNAVRKIADEKGRIDVLVNNAGMDVLGAFEDLPEVAWREVMEVNFFGPVMLTREVLPLMREYETGLIVMMSSLSGLIGLPGNAAYASAKFALEGATESLRHEVARFGIRVALIEPGAFKTAMAGKLKLAKDYPVNSPYLPLLKTCLPAPHATPSGDNPQVIAKLIFEIATNGNNTLRYPAGEQAKSVVHRLSHMTDQERRSFVTEVTGSDWWINPE